LDESNLTFNLKLDFLTRRLGEQKLENINKRKKLIKY
jgi:hypothetical protein